MGFVSERDAIKNWLDSETWPETINAASRNVVAWESDKTSALATYVVPLAESTSTGARKGPQRNRRYGVFLLQQLAKNDIDAEQTRQDQLINLADEISRRLGTLKKLDGKDIIMDHSEPRTPLDQEAARAHVFLAGVLVEVIDA